MGDVVKIVVTVAGAAIGLGMALYLLFSESNAEEPQRLGSNSRRRSSPPPRWSPPTRNRRRAISPPRREASTRSTASASTRPTTTRINRGPRQSGETSICPICKDPLRDETISLNCGHVFDDDCYTIWRHVVIANNPLANLCYSCTTQSRNQI